MRLCEISFDEETDFTASFNIKSSFIFQNDDLTNDIVARDNAAV